MPTQLDWKTLNKTINNFGGNISFVWGSINQNNAQTILKMKCDKMEIFEFLLTNNLFAEANTIASCVSLFDEHYVNIIAHKNKEKYIDLLKELCTDKMILLYESYYQKKILSKCCDDESLTEFNDSYRHAISKRYHDIKATNNDRNVIVELLNEFNFLADERLHDFYMYAQNTAIEYTDKFNILYENYICMMPLIYRIINEYYLEYIKFQIKTIIDIHSTSFIMVSEYYENLKKCLINMPKKYVDCRYRDDLGNNILFYLATLPYLSAQINKDIYINFFMQQDYICVAPEQKNNMGNTIFHMIAEHENEILLEIIVQWLFKTIPFLESTLSCDLDPLDQTTNKIIEFLSHENDSGDTIFDILLVKNNYVMIGKIINYGSHKIHQKLIKRVIKNVDAIDGISSLVQKNDEIYLEGLNHFMFVMVSLKKDIFYDIQYYNEVIDNISKLLAKCDNKLDSNQDYCLQWLNCCISANELEIFNSILEEKIIDNTYLNKIVPIVQETLIVSAIKHCRVPFIKVLLSYNIDLNVVDKNNKDAVINTLETKNLYLIRLIRDHIQQTNMAKIVDDYILLIEKCETFNSLSIYDIICKIFNTLEYLINEIMHDKTT